MKTLHLTLFRRWFDAIARGEKTEEYRAINPFWEKRLRGKTFDVVQFRNGYAKDAPVMRVEWRGLKESTWEGQLVFAIQLGAILELRNYPQSELI